jgi:hypothetical protein
MLCIKYILFLLVSLQKQIVENGIKGVARLSESVKIGMLFIKNSLRLNYLNYGLKIV